MRAEQLVLKHLPRAISSLLLPASLLALWQISTQIGWLPHTLIATPSQVAVDGFNLLFNGTLLHHAWASLRRLAIGFFLGVIFAVSLGTLTGLSKIAERAILPTIGILAPVPVSAWIPLIIILAGIDELSKICVITIGVFFIVFFHTFQGIRSTDSKLIDVAKIFNKSQFQLTVFVLLPFASSQILRGMRSALGLGWVLLVVAEVIASSDGLGWMMWDARNFSRPDDMIVAMIAVGILGTITDTALAFLQKRVLFWQQTFNGND